MDFNLRLLHIFIRFQKIAEQKDKEDVYQAIVRQHVQKAKKTPTHMVN